ncbi:hypothetical protein JL721_8846 [Aureococcus anophagefferens]|nr:hypothetical protein JL721_8846 [Aureococcus anophagefferens]
MATWLLEPEFERYEETKERKLVFAAHDPSARNHVLALCDACDALGPCSYVDLSFCDFQDPDWHSRLLDGFGPFDGLVVGCSSNGREFELIATAARASERETVMLAELGLGRPGVPRLAGLAEASAPDLILVTNERAEASVAARLDAVGAKKTRVVLGGSGHLEKLRSSRTAELDRDAVRAAYNCARDAALVAYFACCDDAAFGVTADDVAAMVDKALDVVAGAEKVLLVVRPHPRASAAAHGACRRLLDRFEHVNYDDNSAVDLDSLLRAADAALSYGSTTGLEAAALGVLTAFVVGAGRQRASTTSTRTAAAAPPSVGGRGRRAFLAQARRAGGRRAPAADADHATGPGGAGRRWRRCWRRSRALRRLNFKLSQLSSRDTMRTFTLAAIIAAAAALRPTQRPNLAVARKAMANAVLAGAAIAGAAAARADTLDPATSLVGELAGLKADVRAGKANARKVKQATARTLAPLTRAMTKNPLNERTDYGDLIAQKMTSDLTKLADAVEAKDGFEPVRGPTGDISYRRAACSSRP